MREDQHFRAREQRRDVPRLRHDQSMLVSGCRIALRRQPGADVRLERLDEDLADRERLHPVAATLSAVDRPLLHTDKWRRIKSKLSVSVSLFKVTIAGTEHL